MKPSQLFPLAAALALAATLHAADAPLYSNDFETAEVDATPADFMVMAGTFLVKPEGGGKCLELPGEPLDTFGLLFGPVKKGDLTASARFLGTKKGRKFPSFGVSLGGVGGYRLQVSAGKKTLELFQGDEACQSVAYEWKDDSWTSLRIQIRKTAEGWMVEGKVWPAGTPEPAAWTIRHDAKAEPATGRAGIWGSPYSGTPIRFDDLLLAPAH